MSLLSLLLRYCTVYSTLARNGTLGTDSSPRVGVWEVDTVQCTTLLVCYTCRSATFISNCKTKLFPTSIFVNSTTFIFTLSPQEMLDIIIGSHSQIFSFYTIFCIVLLIVQRIKKQIKYFFSTLRAVCTPFFSFFCPQLANELNFIFPLSGTEPGPLFLHHQFELFKELISGRLSSIMAR